MKKLTYSELKVQLDEVLASLQNPDVDVDKAIDLHAQASALIKELELHLKDVELKIKQATKK